MMTNTFVFGATMLVAGMGGTLVTLCCMSLMMAGLGKLFPHRESPVEE